MALPGGEVERLVGEEHVVGAGGLREPLGRLRAGMHAGGALAAEERRRLVLAPTDLRDDERGDDGHGEPGAARPGEAREPDDPRAGRESEEREHEDQVAGLRRRAAAELADQEEERRRQDDAGDEERASGAVAGEECEAERAASRR